MRDNDFLKTYNYIRNERIGENIQHRREELGLTLREAASATGVSLTELASFEYGAMEIYPETLMKLCQGLKTDYNTLFEGLEDLPLPESMESNL